jgi:hypothetical protein
MAKLGRRSFLRLGAGAAVAVVAAPLYIPADRLAFGVPKAIVVPEPEPLLVLGGEVNLDAFRMATQFSGPAYHLQSAPLSRGPITLAEAAQCTPLLGEPLLIKMFMDSSPVFEDMPMLPMSGIALKKARREQHRALSEIIQGATDSLARLNRTLKLEA